MKFILGMLDWYNLKIINIIFENNSLILVNLFDYIYWCRGKLDKSYYLFEIRYVNIL